MGEILNFEAKQPKRVADLPTDADGRPIPYGIAKLEGRWQRDKMSPEKWLECTRKRLCFVCGDKLGAHTVFLTDITAAITRSTDEPGCHRVCAEWLVKDRASKAITALVGVKIWQVLSAGPNAAYIKLGPQKRIEFFANGKPATDKHINHEIKALLPHLDEVAATAGHAGQLELRAQLGEFLTVIEKSGVELL